MLRFAIATLVLAGAGRATAQGQQSKPDEPKPAAVKPGPPDFRREAPAGELLAKSRPRQPLPGEVDVAFLNDSNVRMVVQSKTLEITTVYGKLTVPLEDVRAIEFGVHFPEGYAAVIDRALEQLNSANYREREKASKTLLDLGPFSYPGVYQVSQGKDLETSRRAKELLKQLQAAHPRKDLKTSADDKIVTPTFTIIGRIVTPTLQARTEYFGEVALPLAKMRTLRAVAAPGLELDVSVDAAKYANAGQWMPTKFHVDGKSKLLITAKGLVDTWPQQPGQYMVGPSGQAGRVALGNGIVIQRAGGGAIVGLMQGGVLFGKIGEDGQPFVIGDRYEGTPEEAGPLYLHIGPSPWNCNSTGAYDVKIRHKS
jgi:hypothetical protein